MIRMATLEDALEIYNLEMSCFLHNYSLQTIQDDLANDKNAFFLYENESGVIGYISIYYFLDEANLQKVAVIEKERRKGVASKLIQHTIEFLKLKGVERYYLEVNEHNLIAIDVYEKLGFKKISTRKKYYGNDDAIILEMHL